MFKQKLHSYCYYRKGLLSLIALLISFTVYSQTVIKGVVKDANGNTLPGVSIRVKEAPQVGTISDPNGNFSLKIVDGYKTLIASYLGYQTQEVAIGGRFLINISLQESQTGLNEVVITGYGSGTAKKDLTGSVGVVSMSDLQKAPVQSFAEALAGRVAGVQVVSPDGKPGSAPAITIRGIGSITQDSSPLYVIDGVPIENPDNNMIDPINIETITVLKDASATAIYGSRGGNGVIVITTKRGQKGPSKVDYTGYYGINQPYKFYKLMSPYEFVRLASDQFGVAANPYLTGGKTLEDYRNVKGTDWQDLLIRTGTADNHSMNISGGSDNTLYSMSGNYVKQTGIIVASDYTRYQGKLTLDQKVGERARVGGYLTYSRNMTTGGSTSDGATSSLFFSAYTARPIAIPAFADIPLEDQIYDPDNVYPADNRLNPLLSYTNEFRHTINKNLLGSVYVDYNILKNLKFTARGSINSNDQRVEVFNNSQTRSGGIYGSLGVNGTITNGSTDVYTNTNLLQYNAHFNNKHNLNVLLGTDVQRTNYKTFAFGGQQISAESLGISGLDAGVVQQTATSRLSYNTLLSGYGQVNYNYASKYYFTGSFRADGSSKFINNRWGYFPGVAVKWKFSEEGFMKKQHFISDANIRLSYGSSGNNRVGDFDGLSQIGFNSQLYLQGGTLIGNDAVTANLPNANLKWETDIKQNAAIDLGFLNNRINLTVEVYNDKIKDLLYKTPLPGNTGYTTTVKNIAALSNHGVEITLGGDVVNTKNFSYSASFNISLNRNKLDALSDPTEEGLLSYVNWDANFAAVPAFIAKVGGPLGQIYGLVSKGLYQFDDFDKLPNGTYVLKAGIPTTQAANIPGDAKFLDINGDGVIDANDRTVIGNGYPIHVGGFSNNFRYKNFDLNLFFQWSYGNNIINANRIWFNGGEITYRSTFGPQNELAEYANRWSIYNTDTDIARTARNYTYYAAPFVEDGSYIRLKTFNLGYRFPQKMLSRYKISQLRLFVSAANLITITGYKGYDPEVSTYTTGLTPAIDYSSYPRPITITGGINLTL